MEVCLIAHNIRSSHNAGSLLRTADCLGAQKVYFTGYSPYPKQPDDTRLPHVANKAHAAIHKTALGAEATLSHEHVENLPDLITQLKRDHYTVVALEQDSKSQAITTFKPPAKLALIVGNEVAGLDTHELQLTDAIVEIPMHGHKESLNVAQAAAIGLFYCLFMHS